MIYPPDELQGKVMKAIYSCIKTGRILECKEIIAKVVSHLIKEEVEVIICGCAEVCLVLRMETHPYQ